MMYNRILLKLSGESLGDWSEALGSYARQIAETARAGVQVAIVVGGGNIYRGGKGVLDRVTGDQMGMLATVINSLALGAALQSEGVRSRVFTSVRMEPVGELYSRNGAVEALERGEVVLVGGGTGNPFFTTDTAAALRAVELGADVLLKGTRVDGIYTADPERDPSATKFDRLTFDEVIGRNLKVMDMTAFMLCRENRLPIIVFDMDTEGNLGRVVKGENIGTTVKL